jgi:hypothetical protein
MFGLRYATYVPQIHSAIRFAIARRRFVFFYFLGEIMFQKTIAFAILFLPLWGEAAHADFAILSASKDNTLYESSTGALSNGAGDYFFVGRTSANTLRRGLIQFDLTSIPLGATVDSVSLRLTLNRAEIAGAADVSLHRTTTAWGEGTSNAPGQEGGGATATPGDATWIHSSLPGSLWLNQGGDFVVTASATQRLDADNTYIWTSTPSLVADVQQWVNNPNTNFGWLIRGDELNGATAMRFLSRTGPGGQAFQPELTVNFTAVPEPTSFLLLVSFGITGMWMMKRVRHNRI